LARTNSIFINENSQRLVAAAAIGGGTKVRTGGGGSLLFLDCARLTLDVMLLSGQDPNERSAAGRPSRMKNLCKA
jgi:hypothetical protein